MVPVVLGIALSTKGENDFILIGALGMLSTNRSILVVSRVMLVLTLLTLDRSAAATVCTALRALKSVLQGVLLNNDLDRLDSLNLMFYSAPISGLLLVPFAFWYVT